MRQKPLTWLRNALHSKALADLPVVEALVALLMLIAGCVYIANSWSPSSYGHVLRVAGAAKDGVVWGEPRAIRSDEWSVTTPLTQATVNNRFERFNKTSYYKEDLRINYAMPIYDWGMVFKPTFWGFLFLQPAMAYSVHYFLMFAIFIAGYARLMRIMGANAVQAYVLSTSLYFCGFVQFFWNSNASLFAFFPWVIVALCSPMHVGKRMLLYYWIACCWLIGTFYPPLFISLGFVALVVLAAFRMDVLQPKMLLITGAVTALACGTAVFYLWDYLLQTINTVYPGQRTSVAGYYPRFIFLTQLWPAELFDSNFRESVDFTNVTGIGTVGLYWTLAALCFANWAQSNRLFTIGRRRTWILITGLSLTMMWMYAPMPGWLGKALLWDRVPPERMVFASGLLWAFLVWHITLTLGLQVTARRFVAYSLAVVAGGLIFEWITRDVAGPWKHLIDLAIVPAMGVAVFCATRFRVSVVTAVLVAGTLTGAVVFGRFNPIQSTIEIFDRAPSPLSQTLDAYVDSEGILPVQRDGLIGATLNGMGYRAVAHLVALPPMPLWQQKFGPLSVESEAIFNRYAHIRLVPENLPRKLENDQVGVPATAFRAQPSATIATQGTLPVDSTAEGSIDEVRQEGQLVTIRGWAPWKRGWADRQLIIETSMKNLEVIAVSDQERWDVVEFTRDKDRLLSGFVVQVRLGSGTEKMGAFSLYARSDELAPLHLISRRGEQ